MSIFHDGTAPPIREDGLPHTVVEFSDGTWACNFGCASCRAAGFYLHGKSARRSPSEAPKEQQP